MENDALPQDADLTLWKFQFTSDDYLHNNLQAFIWPFPVIYVGKFVKSEKSLDLFCIVIYTCIIILDNI